VIAAALTLSAALLTTPTALAMQETAPAPSQPAEVTDLVLPGATAAPGCGPRPELANLAFCVTAPLGSVGALADAYIARFRELEWLQAGGGDNRVVFIRRREAGGCDGLQMLAFYDESQPATETSPGYLAFAAIPGDVCAAAASPAQPQAGSQPQ